MYKKCLIALLIEWIMLALTSKSFKKKAKVKVEHAKHKIKKMSLKKSNLYLFEKNDKTNLTTLKPYSKNRNVFCQRIMLSCVFKISKYS